MTDEEGDILNIFIESVDELLNSTFLNQVVNLGIITNFTWNQNGFLQSDRVGPELEAVKAFILTIRFFCQDNEKTSLRNMDSMIAAMQVPQNLKDDFTNIRAQLNAYLDSLPEIAFEEGGAPLNRRNIFDTFLYGKFAHANRAKRNLLRTWQQRADFEDRRAIFDRILLEFVLLLNRLSSVCKNILN
jgi:hypothetical protein